MLSLQRREFKRKHLENVKNHIECPKTSLGLNLEDKPRTEHCQPSLIFDIFQLGIWGNNVYVSESTQNHFRVYSCIIYKNYWVNVKHVSSLEEGVYRIQLTLGISNNESKTIHSHFIAVFVSKGLYLCLL